MCDRWHQPLALIFGGVLAGLLAMMVLLVPLGQVPDEGAHLLRADGLRHGQIIGHRSSFTLAGQSIPSAGVKADLRLLAVTDIVDPVSRRQDPARLARAQALDWGASTYVHIPNTAVYGPIYYLPAAVTLRLAKWTGVGPYDAAMAVRGVNALIYAMLAAASVMIAIRGRLLLLLVLGLPMALELAASANQDGLIIATAALCAALLDRARTDNASTPWMRAWAWPAAALLLLPLIMAKPPYLPLALLLLGQPSLVATLTADHAGRWRLLITGTVLVVTVGWTMFNMMHVAVPFDKLPYQTGPLAGVDQTLTATDAGWQARILLSNPALLITMPLDTMYEGAWVWWTHFIGVLGPLIFPFSDDFYTGWPLAAGLILLAAVPLPRRSQLPLLSMLLDAVVPVLLVLATIWLIIIAQYLSWTRVGYPLAEGVQGRYFIPLLPCLILVLPSRAQAGIAWRGRVAEGAGLLLMIYSAQATLGVLLRGYYGG